MSEHVAIIEEVARGRLSMAGVLNLHILCCHLLLHSGSERQRRQLRPQMASGDLRAAISLSEPHAGSDLQSTRHGVVPGKRRGVVCEWPSVRRRWRPFKHPSVRAVTTTLDRCWGAPSEQFSKEAPLGSDRFFDISVAVVAREANIAFSVPNFDAWRHLPRLAQAAPLHGLFQGWRF